MTDPQENPIQPPRSQQLTAPTESMVLVVDVQEKLSPLIDQGDRMLHRIASLLEVARLLDVPIFGCEQYPEKLGSTLPNLRSKIAEVFPKRMFSCRETWGAWHDRLNPKCQTMVVCGIESHVCVLQTVLDMIGLGWRILLPIDAIGARRMQDHEIALRRMEGAGAILTTTESLIFEWTETSLAPKFREISSIVKSL